MTNQISILCASRYEDQIGGNLANFRRVIQAAKSQDVVCKVVSLHPNYSLTSYRFDDETTKFVRVDSTPSRVLYNRISTRALENHPVVQRMLNDFMSAGHVITNPRFLTKTDLMEVWQQNKTMRHMIPDSVKLSTFTTLQHFLDVHHQVYVKPVTGKAGIGIVYLLAKPGQRIDVYEQGPGQLHHVGIMPSKEWYSRHNQQHGGHAFILQEDANPIRFADRRFDLRMLVQRDEHDHFHVSGAGIRQAQARYSITTHVPNGGSILTLSDVLPTLFATRSKSVQEAAFLAATNAAYAVATLPGVWSEVSVDMGLRKDGTPILYEANAKPMKFDEPKIEHQSKQRIIRRLVSLESSG